VKCIPIAVFLQTFLFFLGGHHVPGLDLKIENAEKSRSAPEPYKINVPCLAHRMLFSYMLRSVEGMSLFAIELIETVNITSAYLLQYLLFALHAIPAENPQFS